MKSKRIKLATLLFTGALVLAGCSSQNESKSDTSSKKPTTTTAVNSKKNHKTQTTTAKKSDTLWDTNKDNRLKSFIDQWAPTMKQSYVKYDGTHSLKTSTGTVYPDDLSKVNVEGSNASIGWSKDGSGNNEYNVVAIYNYNGTVPPLPNHITYFFAFHDNQPIVLVDQSRDGTPDLTETENSKVKLSFAAIVAGKKINAGTSTNSSSDRSKSNSSSSVETTDPKLIGVMVRQLAMPSDDLSKEINLGIFINDGRYWIGTGTAISDVGYKINGDTVSYYMLDPNSGDSTADESYIEHNISLSELESKYYSTNDQKQTVQSVAGKIPAIESEDNE
ncbi:Lreu_0056 family protein [Companilactobacillus nodensis]|uniref:Uncharacterized protein n=1 Tax=Companilactobacillus nodensis DSM 19682 = JCM 14932 = NBRC 107160 TaxID=1423775 RepID=A0A0R1KCC0_9LACO|nr:DUF4767 domain-containing protein [Companilactobacillus nodensis]KRK81270.1 hypothetical protein FD03_GL000862 [Companilactobacillus nodensis DSM 19682 = JCM 14932 = NBRC 107160]